MKTGKRLLSILLSVLLLLGTVAIGVIGSADASLPMPDITYIGLEDPIVISEDKTIELNGVTIEGTDTDPSPITIEPGVTVNIILSGENTLTAKEDKNGAGIYVKRNNIDPDNPIDAVLNIYGREGGKLTVTGGNYGAGIGGRDGEIGSCTPGIINIRSGEIYAQGGNQGAGIGSGRQSSGNEINIYGGNVTAIAGNSGAGIGTGYATSGGSTNKVGSYSAGIIYITGGKVRAASGIFKDGYGFDDFDADNADSFFENCYEANGFGAGIGGGYGSNGCSITIGGDADVIALGSCGGAGIGSGRGTYKPDNYEADCTPYDITIEGSAKVVAASPDDTRNTQGGGAGIGGGRGFDDGGSIKILDNADVTAIAEAYAAAIGGSWKVVKINTENSSLIAKPDILEIAPTATVKAVSDGFTNSIGYPVGSVIQYGTYPQSEVKDANTLAALNENLTESGWVSYGYYSGTGTSDDGQMAPGDFMKYQDVVSEGERYRAVTFTSYRPYAVGDISSDDGSNSHQDENGYYVSDESNTNIYWFKFEPIEWRVLDPEEGLIVCNSAIDSQAYNNYILYADSEYWGNADKEYKANDYANSSIRAWLNDDFMNTSFSASQQDNIKVTELDNSCPYDENYNSATTNDKIFLLSYNEVTNSAYGFSSTASEEDNARKMAPTDYALCQGIWKSSSNGNSYWWLRSPYFSSFYACVVDYDGYADLSSNVAHTTHGVSPALKLQNLESDPTGAPLYKTGDTLYYGTYPQSLVTDETILTSLNAKLSDDGWVSYGYYSGTGTWDDGMMTSGDFMRYQDAVLDGVKYRAVIFDSYRPYEPGFTSNENNTWQDDNGYEAGTVYWFEFEPLEWRVLDPDNGLIICETIIDAQPYNNFVISADSEYWGDADKTYYPNNYAKSNIREWLNNNFYNTAFSNEQKSNMKAETLNNDGYYTLIGTSGYEKYDAPSTDDKVFLLSYDDVLNSSYGFSTGTRFDPARGAEGSDYAKCQGLYVYSYSNPGYSYDGCSNWRLRSPGDDSHHSCVVRNDGFVCYNYSTGYSREGVRPSLKLQELKSDPTGAPLYTIIEIPEGIEEGYKNIEYTGVESGEGYTLSGTVTATDAGDYTATATLKDGFIWSDGTLEPKDISWKITPRLIWYASEANLENDSFVYDGTAKEPGLALLKDTYIQKELVEGVDYEIIHKEWRNNINASDPNKVDSEKLPTAVIAVEGKGNYKDSQDLYLTFDILKADPEVTAPVPVEGLKADGNPKELVAPGRTTGGTLEYSLDGENFSENVPSGKAEGEYTVYYRVTGDENYNDVAAQTVSAAIGENIHTVTYIVDGEEFAKFDVNFGQSVARPRTPQKDGYEFAWIDEIPETMPAEDVTINGGFTPIEYTATFVDENSETVKKVTFTVETEALDEPAVPEKANYTGEWEEYTIEAKDLTIKPVYTLAGETKVTADCGNEITLDYKESKTYNFNVEYMPEGASAHIFINGEDKGEGTTYEVKEPTDDYTVECKAIDADGNEIATSGEIKAKVKNCFFDRLKWFFNNFMTVILKSFFDALLAAC